MINAAGHTSADAEPGLRKSRSLQPGNRLRVSGTEPCDNPAGHRPHSPPVKGFAPTPAVFLPGPADRNPPVFLRNGGRCNGKSFPNPQQLFGKENIHSSAEFRPGFTDDLGDGSATDPATFAINQGHPDHLDLAL